MDFVLNIFLGIFYVLPIIFVWILIFNPERLDFNNISDYSDIEEKVIFWISLGAAISLGIILYIGLDRAFSFIPESWRFGVDEDGEPNTVRGLLVGFSTIIATIYIMMAVIGYRLSIFRRKMSLKK